MRGIAKWLGARPTARPAALALWLAPLVLALLTAAAAGQDRRAVLRTPGLILETGAPTAATHALEFTADGRNLLAAGDDKVVRSWPVDQGALDRRQVRTFRWAIYREQRGTIYAMALSREPEQRYVAVAGIGLRSGSMAVIDRNSGEVAAGLTAPGQPGAVTALTFSPDNQALVYGTEFGVVSAWTWQQPGNLVRQLARHTAPAGAGGQRSLNRVRRILALPDGRALSTAEDGTFVQSNWQQPGGAGEALTPWDLSQVAMVAVSRDNGWLAASGPRRSDGRWCVELRPVAGGASQSITLPDGQYPRAVALDASGRSVAIGVHARPVQPLPYKPVEAHVYVYDVAAGKLQTDRLPRPSYLVESLAFSPDGRWLVVAGGNDAELVVWDRTAGRPGGDVHSRGRSIWSVAWSTDGSLLGFRQQRSLDPAGFNDWGTGPWRAFDLHVRNWAEPRRQLDFQPIKPLESAAGWSVEPDAADPYVWRVVNAGNGARFPLPLDRDRELMPRCYTFVQPAAGEPVRLIVGHMWGLSLFELTDTGPRRTRLLVGHQDDVRAVGLSPDQKQVVSSSRDQTIAGWTLAPWENQAELGASFKLDGGRLLVVAVAPGSPGWEAGLTAGDEVRRLAVGAVEDHDGPPHWLAALQNPTPGQELYFEVARAGEPKPVPLLTTVRQRPLWRFFPAQDEQWVLWRWRDFYYDSSVSGDDLIGWQINQDVDRTPTFVRAEQNRQRFHRPDKVEATLRTMSPVPDEVRVPDLLAPRIQLTLSHTGPQQFQAVIEVTGPEEGDTPRLREVNLWLNDFKFRRWADVHAPFTQTVSFGHEQLRTTPNYIVAQAYGAGGVRADTQEVVLEGMPSGTPARMYAVCVGVNEYRHTPPVPPRGDSWNDLLFARQDAESMFAALDRQASHGGYQPGRRMLLVDSQVSRAAILKGIAQTARDVRPDDLLMLFLAGHGWAKATGPTSRDPQSFCFVTPQFEVEQASRTGVPFTENSDTERVDLETLYEALIRVPCRKTLMLDCCHSGSVIGQHSNVIRALIPEHIGPVIMAACDKDEFSWDLFFKGHGAFTAALLELQGDKFTQADADGNGVIDAHELSGFLEKRVPQLIELARPVLAGGGYGLRPEQTQRPQSYVPQQQVGLPLFVRPAKP